MVLLLLLAMGMVQQPVDSISRSEVVLDSLYVARDTTGLVKALSTYTGEPSLHVQLLRGIAALWTARPNEAAEILRPLVDSSRAGAVDSAHAQDLGVANPFYGEPILEGLTRPGLTGPPAPERIPSQLGLIGLLFALFLVPKMLQRFRIPGAITSLLMGVGASQLGWFPHDPTLTLFATLGIVSLFLFAGLEIDGSELRLNVKPLVLHAAIWTTLAILTAVAAAKILGVPPRAAALLALALVTPSTGFILSSLSSFGLTPPEQKTVRTYAIGSELVALTALFFVLQSTSARQLAISIAAMAGVVIVIPLAFRAFAKLVAPYAPRSEFAFLLMVGVACAYATRLLGVYYLVGAFLVGVAAQRFRGRHPAMSSEKMVDALEAFGSVFIPFYFFHAGTEIVGERITWIAVASGLLLVAILVPIRVAVISLHRKIVLKESFADSRRVGAAMVPTLVFTLVILGILTDRFGLSSAIGGALVLYTIINTTLPAFILRAQPADFEDVEAIPLEGVPAEG